MTSPLKKRYGSHLDPYRQITSSGDHITIPSLRCRDRDREHHPGVGAEVGEAVAEQGAEAENAETPDNTNSGDSDAGDEAPESDA